MSYLESKNVTIDKLWNQYTQNEYIKALKSPKINKKVGELSIDGTVTFSTGTVINFFPVWHQFFEVYPTAQLKVPVKSNVLFKGELIHDLKYDYNQFKWSTQSSFLYDGKRSYMISQGV